MYLSTENGGGANGSRLCSLAKRAYIALIISWISPDFRAAASRSARICAKKSFIAPRTPFVNRLASIARRVRPALARSDSRPISS